MVEDADRDKVHAGKLLDESLSVLDSEIAVEARRKTECACRAPANSGIC